MTLNENTAARGVCSTNGEISNARLSKRELDRLLNSKSWEEVIQKGKDGGSYAPYGFRAVAKMGIKVVLISSISIEKTARTPIIGARDAKEAIEKAIQIEGKSHHYCDALCRLYLTYI
jgi:hypothetical protein